MRQSVTPGGDSSLPRHATSPIRPEPDPGVAFFERRQTPTTLGLGLLERIPRETIEANADPDDEDGDGIAGRIHELSDGRLGRFGWKANVPSVREFVRDALSGELGITVPDEAGFTFGRTEDDDDIADPEIDSNRIDALTDFIALLGPPPRTRASEELEDEGARVFERIGCADCHLPTLLTADGVEVQAYTDLLLHEIAAPEALGIVEGDAGIRDFRTAPLWGLGQSPPYLHDGRADTIEDAIEEHAGEATQARSNFSALSASERQALLAFLASL